MNITKADLVEILARNTVTTKVEAKQFVHDFFEEMALALEDSGYLTLAGFGQFKVRQKRSRLGRNPRTGEEALIAERRVVTFHPSPKLKKMIAQHRRPAAEAVRERREEDEVLAGH